MRRFIELAVVAAVVAAGSLSAGRLGFQDSPKTIPYAADDFLIAPVRVHLMRLKDGAGVGTNLTTGDIERIFRKANGIWHSAGIHLWVESVVGEPPMGRRVSDTEPINHARELLELRPRASRADGMFHVYYIGRTSINGLYVGHDAVFVQEKAELDRVPGGIDEPLPRVTAHELGHGFGLRHRQARTNLMASGTTGTSLNEEEIHTARRTAESLGWVTRAGDFLESAQEAMEAGNSEGVSRLRAILSIPGKSALKDRAEAVLLDRSPRVESVEAGRGPGE